MAFNDARFVMIIMLRYGQYMILKFKMAAYIHIFLKSLWYGVGPTCMCRLLFVDILGYSLVIMVFAIIFGIFDPQNKYYGYQCRQKLKWREAELYVVLLLTFSGLRNLFMLSISLNANYDLKISNGCILNRFDNIKNDKY